MNIILLGPPGSGKGTQAEQMEAVLGLTHVSSGDLFRENIRQGTELGSRAQQYMNRGELVPDDLTIEMLRERFGRPDVKQGVLLDGFPRTLAQAEALDSMMAGMGRKIDVVINIRVPDEEIVKRLSGRLICRECQTPFHTLFRPFESCPLGKCQGEFLYQREDDRPETVRARLANFQRQTAPLVEYYAKHGVLVTVDGVGSREEVTGACLKAARGAV